MTDIRVEISADDILKEAFVQDSISINMYICERLKEAGIPIIGGPILPKVDLSKGELITWDDYKTGKKIYLWKVRV